LLWILSEQDRADEGIEYLQRAADLAPQVLEVRFHLAHAQVQLGQVTNARATLETLLLEDGPFAQRGAAEALLESL
jgi:thioredoxin-like negative regulator of GroEL